jgi:ATP-dependent RNA circularization protein (DNA/RNA ligase family)
LHRHWGLHTGDLSVKTGNGTKLEAHATNEVIEVYGVSVAKVNEKFEIEDLQTFYDPSDMLRQMAKNRKEGSINPEELVPTGKCPFNPK